MTTGREPGTPRSAEPAKSVAVNGHAETSATYDYGSIPVGYYDRIFHGPKGIRRLWHVSKFERVLDCLPEADGGSILDVGCFAGTFLSMIMRHRFERQLGVDILPEQIAYARHHHGTAFREFRQIDTIADIVKTGERFDVVTLIEVIEHLSAKDVAVLIEGIWKVLKPGGQFVLTTPNYGSMWPVIELALDRLSDVKYEEQHITKFSFFGLEDQLAKIYPVMWKRFTPTLKTTTHFLTPFMAGVSYELARGLSRALPHKSWAHPAGNLILTVLEKRADSEE